MLSRLCFPLFLLPSLLLAQRAVLPDASINSRYEEREPTLSPDGNTLYFWRRECPDNSAGFNDPGDIWYSTRDNEGRWLPAQRFGSPLNSKGHDFVWGVSDRHDTLFLMQTAPGVQEAGISYSVKRGRIWSAPEPLHIRTFRYSGSFKDYFRTRDNLLLLPNEGYPSFGGSDLYICFPINDTAWSKPVNLGPDINGPGNEDAPFLSPDGQALYFNSDGATGDHNIFVSYRLDNTWQRWTKPVLLPAPINSPGYDFDFQLSADGKMAVWCSDRGSLGSTDIFMMDLSSCEVDLYPEEELTYCLGESVTLEAGFFPSRNAEYQWFKNGSPVRGAFQSSLRVDQEGEYQVVRKVPGCEARSAVRRVRFVPAPSPLVEAAGDVICLEDSVLLLAKPAQAASFQWYKNGLAIPEATRPDYWADTPGSYAVEVAMGQCATRSPGYELLTFNPPLVFTEEDTLEGWMPILPRWEWTNKVRNLKGVPYARDLVAGPRNEIYYLTQTDNKGRYTQRISSFFPHGLERGVPQETDIPALGIAFLATDPDGNLLVASEHEYLRKFRPDGRVMWWKDEAHPDLLGLCSDPLGNIYTAGRFRDSIRISSERLGAPDRGAVFLAKHSPRGELLWVKSFSVDFYDFDFGNALASDCEGNVYMAGGFDLVADFGRFPLRGTLLKENYFLVKLNPEGEVLFSRKINTERTRVKSGDLHVDCQGQASLLLNRQWITFAANGIDLWSGELLQPSGTYALNHRLVAHQGDLYASGLTMDGQSFVTKLNRMYNQVLLWEDRGASISERDLPAIAVDDKGGILVGGISKGSRFQGVQFDLTSGSPVFVMKYARPMVEATTREPLSLCGDEPVVLLVREEAGLQYQWYRDGKPIPGATQTALRASREGTYQVLAVAAGCERMSDPQVVTACGEQPPAEPVLARPEPVRPQPEPVATPRPPRGEVDYGFGGEPSRLRGRRVKTQDEVVLTNTRATIYLWDHGAVDLDTVSINLNGEWIVERYALQKDARQLEVKLQPGDNYLMLFAHNLGTTPPNTASLRVDDGNSRKTLQLRSSLRNCGMLRIRVE